MSDQAIEMDILPDESLKDFIKRYWDRYIPHTEWALECFNKKGRGIILTKDSTGHDYIYGWEETRELPRNTTLVPYSDTLKALDIQNIGEL